MFRPIRHRPTVLYVIENNVITPAFNFQANHVKVEVKIDPFEPIAQEMTLALRKWS